MRARRARGTTLKEARRARCAVREPRVGSRSGPAADAGGPGAYEDLLQDYLANLELSDNPRLADLVGAMRGALLAKGQRVHAALCIEVAGVFGLRPADVLPAAAAIESVHTLLWIHDGLPALADGEPQRRAFACHEEYGEATAILAGDGFLGTSLALMTTEQKGTPEQIVGAIRELARSAGVNGMIGGRVLEAGYAGRAVDAQTSGAIHDRAAGALFEASALIGATLAGALPKEREAVAGYARRLALCFRVVDEALRTVGASTSPADGRHERATFPAVQGLRGARLLADDSLREALEALDGIEGDTAGLAELARRVRRGEFCARASGRVRRDI